MTSLSARKVVRDLLSMRGRVAMMIVAVAAGVAAVGTVFGAQSMLESGIRDNYVATRPASATLVIPGGADDAALRLARTRPGVLDAALRTRVRARVVPADGRRVPFLLFVAPASDRMRVAGFAVEEGHWPPAADELLIDRSTVAFFGLHAGERVEVELRNGRTRAVRISGVVHDGAISPSAQERVGYAYGTPALLARLGAPAVLDDLEIIVGDGGHPARGVARIDAVAQDVGKALRAHGVSVARIDAPPPFRHPHQAQMETALMLLQTFAVLALLLSAMLAATLIRGMLAQQIRQIGVMKTLGAGTTTVFGMYLLMTAAIAAAATLFALVPGAFGARLLASVVGDQFGIELAGFDVPWSVFFIEICAGVALPVLVALGSLIRGTSVTVREAIDGSSHGSAVFGTTGVAAWLARRHIGNRTIRLAVRNVARRPGRLGLIVMLLGASGAMFVSALSTADGLQAVVDDGLSHRHYDLEVRLGGSEDAGRVARVMANVSQVAAFETASSAPASSPHGGSIEVTRTYPDGAHGSYALTSVHPAGDFVKLPLREGRWLDSGDAGAVVFNQLVIPQQTRGARVGQDVEIAVTGRITRYRLVGIVSDVGSPATAYVTQAGFARASGEPGRISLVRAVLRDHGRAARAAAIDAIGGRFANDGIAVSTVVSLGQFKLALNGHAAVLANTLGAIAVVMAVAGIFGLGSAVGSSVAERLREFAIMRSVGATSAAVAAIVIVEGMLYGALSAVAAVLASIPLTLMLGGFIGTQAFFVPLPFRLSLQAVLIVTAVALLAAAVVSAVGARAATRPRVRDALATG